MTNKVESHKRNAEKVRPKANVRVTRIDGPTTLVYGSVINPSQPTNFRKYDFTATQFNGPVTDNDKRNIKWSIKCEDGDSTQWFNLPQRGETVQVEALYEYIGLTISIYAYFGSSPVEADGKKPLITPFSVRAIPEIQRRVPHFGGRNCVAARLLEEWFRRRENAFPDALQREPYNNTIVTMSWALSFPRAREIYDNMINNRIWLNPPARQAIRTLLQNNHLLGNDSEHNFNFINNSNMAVVDINSIQSRRHQYTTGNMIIASLPFTADIPIDDLNGALFNFEFKIAIAGVVQPVSTNNSQTVRITRIGIYIRDSFDFVNDQPLGCWRANPPDVRADLFENNYTAVNNNSLRLWRNANHLGGDYVVYSNIVIINRPNDSFVIN